MAKIFVRITSFRVCRRRLNQMVLSLQAERHHLQVFPIVEDIDGLETSMLGLHFTIKTRHFRKGDLKLKCTATLAALYWQSNEASAEPDRPVHHQRSSSSEVYMDSNSRSTLASAAFTVHFLGSFLFLFTYYMKRFEKVKN